MNLKKIITIYGYGYAMAAILDAILKMIAFRCGILGDF